MKEKDKLLTDLFAEITDYADKNNQFSYYELKAYMITDKPEWEAAFNDKQTRAALSEYLKSARKHTKAKTNTMMDSLAILRQAYNKRDENKKLWKSEKLHT